MVLLRGITHKTSDPLSSGQVMIIDDPGAEVELRPAE